MTFMARLKARTLGAVFGGYFLLMFVGAWYVSKDLSIPWYRAEISQLVYLAYLLGGGILVAGVAAGMLVRATSIERRLDALEGAVARGSSPRTAGAATSEKDHVDRDIDDLLESLSEMEATTAEAAVEMDQDVVEAEPVPVAGLTGLGEMSIARARLERQRRSLRAYLAGPGAVGALFMGISAAMLPGAGGFLQTFYVLNTTLILGMAYSWVGLGAYVIAATAAHLRDP